MTLWEKTGKLWKKQRKGRTVSALPAKNLAAAHCGVEVIAVSIRVPAAASAAGTAAAIPTSSDRIKVFALAV